jgi:hypothetical protein
LSDRDKACAVAVLVAVLVAVVVVVVEINTMLSAASVQRVGGAEGIEDARPGRQESTVKLGE